MTMLGAGAPLTWAASFRFGLQAASGPDSLGSTTHPVGAISALNELTQSRLTAQVDKQARNCIREGRQQGASRVDAPELPIKRSWMSPAPMVSGRLGAATAPRA
jgi:hypothetical protein